MLKSIFKNHLLFFSGLILITASNAQAHLGCDEGNTVAECQEHIRQEQVRLLELQGGQSVFIYTDAGNGLSWTSALPGTYTNGCVNTNGRYDAITCTFDVGADGSRQVRVDDSAAAKACRDLRDNAGNLVGARLPTKAEYESLIRSMGQNGVAYYNEGYGPTLTATGTLQMQEIFGDMPNWFWSSSLVTYYSPDASFFNGGNGGYVDDDARRDYAYAVRCVSGR